MQINDNQNPDPSDCSCFGSNQACLNCGIEEPAELYIDDNDWEDYATCHHGIYKGYVGGFCNDCDKEEEERGGLDKCLNCGRYCYGDQLNEHQIHIKPCKNPNEY